MQICLLVVPVASKCLTILRGNDSITAFLNENLDRCGALHDLVPFV